MELNLKKYVSGIFGILFCIVSVCCFAQTETFTSMYDLDFNGLKRTTLMNWQINRKYSQAQVFHDTTVVQSGKHPLVIASLPVFKELIAVVNVELNQNILLPRRYNLSNAKLSLTCKSQNLQEAYLLVSGIGLQNEIVSLDTIPISDESDWNVYSGKLDLRNVKMLDIRIRVKGKLNRNPQYLWLDQLSIQLDGQDINHFSLDDSYEPMDSLIKNPVALSFSNPEKYAQIGVLKDSKILALGETFHGSETMSRVAVDIMKYQILHDNCKLILLERPMTQLFSLNRYIQGDESFCPDSLLLLEKFPFGKNFLQFASWLKEYNSTTQKKVSLYGMDIELNQIDDAHWLCEYLRRLAMKDDAHLVDSLCLSILGGGLNGYDKAISIAQNTPQIKTLLGDTEYGSFIHCLRLLDRIPRDFNIQLRETILLRDSLMSDFGSYLIENVIDSEREKAIVYSHLLHAGYGVEAFFRNNRMFGSFMKDKYEDDYACVGLIVGIGEFLTFKCHRLIIDELTPPVKWSLEHVMGTLGNDYSYASINKDSHAACCIRGFGSQIPANMYVNIVPLSVYMDGVIYVRQSDPLFYPPQLLNKPLKDKSMYRLMNNYTRFREQ